MTPRVRIQFRVGQGTPRVSLLALIFGGHVALGAMVLAWVQRAELRSRPLREPPREPPVERLLFVESTPIPLPRASPQIARTRTAARAPTALPPLQTTTAPVALDTLPRSDIPLPVPTPSTDDSAAVSGVRPRVSDPRLWAPPALPSLFGKRVTPRPPVNDVLARVSDSLMRERGTDRRPLRDWTMTDTRGRKWGWDSGGLRLGPIGIDLQAPAPNDRERALMSARADINRFRHMTPGDADFARLNAELRRRREQAHQKSIPPTKR